MMRGSTGIDIDHDIDGKSIGKNLTSTTRRKASAAKGMATGNNTLSFSKSLCPLADRIVLCFC